MKRVFKVAIFSFLGLALLFFGVLYFCANSLISKFKPELEEIASRAAGTKVSFGSLKTSIFPGVSLIASDIRLGSETDTGLKELNFDLAIIPALTGNLEIERLTFSKPNLKLVRGSSGIRLDGSKPQRSVAPDNANQAPADKPRTQHANPIPEFFKLKLKKFALTQGTISIKDEASGAVQTIENLNGGASLAVEGDKINISNFKLSGKSFDNIPFSLSSANLSYALSSGQVFIEDLDSILPGAKISANADLSSMPVSGKVNLSSLDLDLSKINSLAPIVPALKELKLSGVIKGALNLNLKSAKQIMPTGVLDLKDVGLDKGDLKLSDISGALKLTSSDAGVGVSLQDLGLALNSQALKLSLDGIFNAPNLKLSKLVVTGLGGNITSTLGLGLESSQFNNTIDANSLDISKLVSLSPKPLPKLIGTIQRFRSNLSGTLGAELLSSLLGQIDLSVVNASLPGFNLGGLVLKSIKDLPFLAGALWESLPPNIRDRVAADQTVVRSLKASFAVSGGEMRTSDLVLESDLFSLNGAGAIGFDSNLDLNCTMFFAPDFSAQIIAKAKDLRTIADDQGRIVIPLKLKGKPPGLSVTPDLSKLLKAGTRKLIEDKAGDLLNKALSGKGGKGLGKILGF